MIRIASVIDKQITNLVNSQKNYDREKLSDKLSKIIEEFDPGSERTLAAGLTHASRATSSEVAANG